MSSWERFSYIDLKSAYHQLRLLEEEKHLTLFEANGVLCQYTRLPFKVTNGVPAFQKAIYTIVVGLEGFAVVTDDIVIGGATAEEHDLKCSKYSIARPKKMCNDQRGKIKIQSSPVEIHRPSVSR